MVLNDDNSREDKSIAASNRLGEWGEETARHYLRSHGFTVVAEDIHMGHKEVDIIAIKGGCIHFIEVKTRSNSLDDPLAAIDSRKIRRICRFADTYIRNNKIPHAARFDVIGIVGTIEGGVTSFEYIPDAFTPPLGR